MTGALRLAVFLGSIALPVPVMPGAKGEVSTSWMKQTLTQYFAEARHHVTNPDYKSKAKEFIRKEFDDMGLTVSTHRFDTDLENVEGENVIGILKGKHFGTNQDKIVAIGAHYDTMMNTPGVNDNGAAVVTLLQAAREVSSHTGRNSTVLFIAFDFEEWETGDDAACSEISCGSRLLVTDWLPYFDDWSADLWKGIVVMDTIFNFDDTNDTQMLPDNLNLVFPKVVASVQSDGRQGDFLTVVGRSKDSAALSVFNNSWNRLGEVDYEMEMLKVPDDVPVSSLSDLTRSDHVAFWNVNLSAIFLTDTANLRGYMKECYHQACDNDAHITDKRMEFAAKISRALISWVDSMAPYPETTATASHLTLDGLTTAVVIACVVILIPRHLLCHL